MMARGVLYKLGRHIYIFLIILALTVPFFAVFLPVAVIPSLIALVILMLIFGVYYWKEVTKHERRVVAKKDKTVIKVEELETPLSKLPDFDKMVEEAEAPDPEIKAHLIEGSGMELIERYVPLGEMLFPIAFIADPDSGKYQDGSLAIGRPVCLWHGQAVEFEEREGPTDVPFMYHCPKCPPGGRGIQKSMDDTTKVIEIIAKATIRNHKMPLTSENLMEASRRGCGELPG